LATAPSVTVEALRLTVASVLVFGDVGRPVPVPTTQVLKLPPEVPVMIAVRLERRWRRPLPLPTQAPAWPTVWPFAIVMSPWSVWIVVTPSEAVRQRSP